MGNPLNVTGEILKYLEYIWYNFWTRNPNPELGFWPIILATVVLASQSRAL